MSENKNEILAFACWHPKHGLHEPYAYEGPLAYVRSDDEGLMENVRELNKECGQNTRKGWRIVPVMISLKAAMGEQK